MLLDSRSGARAGAFTRRASAAFRSTPVLVAGAIVALLAACQDPAAPAGAAMRLAAEGRGPVANAAVAPGAGDVIPDEYIVTFRDDVADAPGLARQLVAQHGGTVRFTYTAALRGFAARLPAQAIEALQRNPRVAGVEADRLAQESGAQATPPNWGLDRIDQRLRPMDKSFTYANDGIGVNVYILDSGIRPTHKDFAGRVVSGYTAILDGNGTNDCRGHGTHVAGIVGGTQHGVAKAVRLHAVRVLDCNGSGPTSGVIAAIDWVTQNRVLPAVANLSLSGSLSSALNTAVQNSIRAGVTYVVAAGNNAADACSYSPASTPEALTVGAVWNGDGMSGFSNFGSCLDLFAPGEAIRSASQLDDTTTVLRGGTSMAAPHVAGVAALYLAANPGATPAQVGSATANAATADILSAVPTGTPNRLLFAGFIGAAAPPSETTSPPQGTEPAAPTASFTASCAGGRATCTFDASGSTSGAAIASYRWEFGNGAIRTATMPTTTYTYPAVGTYTVTLTIADAVSRVAKTSQSVRIRRL
jgi:subtilisin family serine protease